MHVCIFTHMRMRMNTQVCWRGQACTLVASIQNAAVKKTVGNFLALNIHTSRRIYAQRGRDRRTYACAHKRTHTRARAHTHKLARTDTHMHTHTYRLQQHLLPSNGAAAVAWALQRCAGVLSWRFIVMTVGRVNLRDQKPK